MDIKEAVLAMREGKKVCRSSKSNRNNYYILSYSNDEKIDIVFYYVENRLIDQEWVFSLDEFEANDWIILENEVNYEK